MNLHKFVSEVVSAIKAPDQAAQADESGPQIADIAAAGRPKPQPEKRDTASLFELVRWTSENAKAVDAAARVKAGDAVSEATARTYAATVGRRMDLDAPGGGQLMEGVTAASWHATKAALSWGALRAWREARRAYDRAQKASKDEARPMEERQAAFREAWRQAERAAAAIEALAAIEAAERPQKEAERQTKRRTMPRAEMWQADVYRVATEVQRPSVAVLWATGCRPAEIQKGVDVRRDNKGQLVVDIPGAKVRDDHGAGQPTRILLIDEKTEAGAALAAELGNKPSLTVQRSATRLNKDFAHFRTKLPWKVSPYSMRHQVAANMKHEMGKKGVPVIAAALGHRVTKSQSRYGTASQAQAGGGSIRAAKATHPVKETRSPTAGPPPKKNSAPKRPGHEKENGLST